MRQSMKRSRRCCVTRTAGRRVTFDMLRCWPVFVRSRWCAYGNMMQMHHLESGAAMCRVDQENHCKSAGGGRPIGSRHRAGGHDIPR
jgi:hypothetical protein